MFKIEYKGDGELDIHKQVLKAIEKGELKSPDEDEREEINCHEHGEIRDMFNTLINGTYWSEKIKPGLLLFWQSFSILWTRTEKAN